MPILHVRALPQADSAKVQTALAKTCIAIANIFDCDPKHVWATWEEIKSGFYVEGDTGADNQPQETHPPIAQLTCFEGKSPEQIEKILLVAAQTLSEELGIPNNIFMTYNEAKSGQVVSGNGVIRKS